MEYFAAGAPDTVLDDARTTALLRHFAAALGPLQRVLLIPPDITRLPSGAGDITARLYHDLTAAGTHVELLPALGTHAAMTPDEIARMFPGVPPERVRVHRFRDDVVLLGRVPGEFVRHASEGRLDYDIRCEVNRLLPEGRWDRIISVGQVVPHEVAGLAGQTKMVFIGVGGHDAIDKTHFLGAACGMERMMGRSDTPVRAVLDYMADECGHGLPLTYVLIVRQQTAGGLFTRGLYAGDGRATFAAAAALARQVNITRFDEPLRRAVVYLDPTEFRSTWLGNKAIYRLRMAMADGGELVIVARGVRAFGEDATIDRLIRRHGYRGTPATLAAVASDPEMSDNLSAAAHLIHGSSEGRFRITYCPGGLSRAEIESVGFEYAPPEDMLRRYPPDRLAGGVNTTADGERFFYVSNPGLGLWALERHFAD